MGEWFVLGVLLLAGGGLLYVAVSTAVVVWRIIRNR